MKSLAKIRAELPRLLLIIALGAVLALAFLAYLQPSFVLDLANRIIMCF